MPAIAMDRWVSRLALRSEITEGDEAALRALPGHLREYKAKADIIEVGDVATEACLVLTGLVARSLSLSGGERQISALYVSGNVPDLHAVAVPAATSSLQALTKTIVLHIPLPALRAAAQESPNLAAAFWRECSIDAMIAFEWVLNTGRRDALRRLAHLICEMAVRIMPKIPDEAFSFELHITQGQLADATGLSAVHVNRSLQALRDRGLLEFESPIVHIADWSLLVRCAEFDPAYLHQRS